MNKAAVDRFRNRTQETSEAIAPDVITFAVLDLPNAARIENVGFPAGVRSRDQTVEREIGGFRNVQGITITVSKLQPAQTVSRSGDLIDLADHGLSTNHPIRFVNGVPPSPLALGVDYYVRDETASAFKLAETPGGAAVALTDDGDSPEVSRVLPEPPNHSRVTAAKLGGIRFEIYEINGQDSSRWLLKAATVRS